MAHVAPHKKQLVEALATRCAQARVVGIANIHGIPAPQFQAIRKKLSGRATITVAKNNLLRLALQQASEEKPDLVKLSDTIEGQTAVVTADINPFRLFKELEATKTRAPARGGEVAPEDLWVRAGETPFKPGPVVGELQKAGIPAAIERGKVVIRQDKLIVKAGQRIPRDVAQQLARLRFSRSSSDSICAARTRTAPCSGETPSHSTTRSSGDRSHRPGGRRSPSRSRSGTRRKKRSVRSSRRPTRRRWGSRWNPNSRRRSRSSFSSRRRMLRCWPSSHARPARPTRRFAR